MNLKNYKISDSQIELIALLLIEQNGSTTNLDIKNQFRSTGFYVTQKEVSDAMAKMETSGKFRSSNNGTYKRFTVGNIIKTTPAPVNISKVQAQGRSIRTTNPATKPTQVLPLPLSGINSNSTAIIPSVGKVYKKAWMVSDGNSKVLYMHKTITRSQAISKFAKATGVKYDDVRCRRVK